MFAVGRRPTHLGPRSSPATGEGAGATPSRPAGRPVTVVTAPMPLHAVCRLPARAGHPDHVALAEHLGYARAWLYDSPALYHDVWMSLARCAERTHTIGLGPAVIVPSLRHPMVTAAAVATSPTSPRAAWRSPSAPGSPAGTCSASGPCAGTTCGLRRRPAGAAPRRGGDVGRTAHPHDPPRGFGAPPARRADPPRGRRAPRHGVARELADGMFSAALPNPEGGRWVACAARRSARSSTTARRPTPAGHRGRRSRHGRGPARAVRAGQRRLVDGLRVGPTGGRRSRRSPPTGDTSPPTRGTSSS